MIDHIILTVSDFARSVPFYEAALAPLGLEEVVDYPGSAHHPHLKGFRARGQYVFWLREGEPRPEAVHVGFLAESHAKVRAFFDAAVAAGAGVQTEPSVQLQYFPGYFAAWVLDPDGHDIEVVNKTGQVD